MPITGPQAQNTLRGAVNSSGLLTSGQQTFASRLSQLTGLDYRVVSAWLLAEESGGAARARQAAGNHDWLNIGYTDKGTFGAGNAAWSNPTIAASTTAAWMQGTTAIPGFGSASQGIRGILGTTHQSPDAQLAAIQKSGWASSGYPSLPSIYSTVSGANSPLANIANAAASPLVGAASAASDIPGAISGAFNSLVSDAKYAGVFVVILVLAAALMLHGFTGADHRTVLKLAGAGA